LSDVGPHPMGHAHDLVVGAQCVHVLDRRLRVNAATQAVLQPASDPINGLSLSGVYNFEEPERQEAAFRRVLDSGAPMVDRLIRGSLKPGREFERSFLVSAFCLRDLRGAVLGLVAVVADATEQEANRRRTAILSRVREAVGHTLDVTSTCRELAHVLVPDFADVAVVDIVEAIVRGKEPPTPASVSRVPLCRAASAGDLGSGKTRAEGELYIVGDRTPLALPLADLRPRLVMAGDSGHWLHADPEFRHFMRDAGSHSLLMVPLVLRGTVLGLLSLFRCDNTIRFDENDLALAADLARHAALCLDNARRYARERATAATVQRRLLPPRPVAHTGLDTAYAYLPGRRTRGSWFDMMPLSSSRSLLVIGQVGGEGIHAAIAMGQLRTAIQALAALDLEADELLARLNDTFLQLVEEHRASPNVDPAHGESLTATYSYAVYDPVSCTCVAGRAGYPSMLLVNPDGSISPMELPDGPLLGSVDAAPFAATTLDINEGSILVLATPTLLHAVGPKHLQQLLSSSGASMQEVCDSVVYASGRGGEPPEGDDILVLARTYALPLGRTAVWSFEPDHEAPASARALTRGWLSQHEMSEEVIFCAEVVVSELVTNAIRYGHPPLNLRVILDRTLTVEVSDASATSPHLRHARATDEGGRGLFIIAQLADRWGTRQTPEGKTIWVELRTGTVAES
jgi:anti-sigma regulatory factor (Ser/Thr protein kinase)